MPKSITEETKKKIEDFIKKNKLVTISQVTNQLQITFKSVNEVLEELKKEKKIAIARYESFSGNKVISQSVEIKWIEN